jgi:VanZ family protein
VAPWLPAAAWMAVIFAASSRPLPPQAEAVPDWFSHGLAWGLLAFLVARALEPTRLPRQVGITLAVAIGYGVIDEIHQSFVPGRVSDPLDVLKDAIGSLLGLIVRLRTSALTPAAR